MVRGQGKILHGVSAAAAAHVDDYLRQAPPLSRGLQARAVSSGQVMKALVYGSRLFGQVVRCLVEDWGHEFAGFIDDTHEGDDVPGRSRPCSMGALHPITSASTRLAIRI